MSQIEPFVQLCESVKQQSAIASLDTIKDLAHEALKLWERSQVLVLIGRVDKLPTQLGNLSNQPEVAEPQVNGQPNVIDIINSG